MKTYLITEFRVSNGTKSQRLDPHPEPTEGAGGFIPLTTGHKNRAFRPGAARPKAGKSFACALLAVCLIATAQHGAAQQKTLICFGDSITAGYGLDASKSYPADLEQLLIKRGYGYRVINQGVSGNTTKDAVARVNSIVALHPEAVVVEFGGNDGLRGLPLDTTRKNLDQVLTTLQAAKIRILLVGITLPRNYGADYIQSFESIYREAAQKHHLALMPMIYDGIYTVPGTIQEDGIHPTAKGSQMIADRMLPLLLPLLHK